MAPNTMLQMVPLTDRSPTISNQALLLPYQTARGHPLMEPPRTLRLSSLSDVPREREDRRGRSDRHSDRRQIHPGVSSHRPRMIRANGAIIRLVPRRPVGSLGRAGNINQGIGRTRPIYRDEKLACGLHRQTWGWLLVVPNHCEPQTSQRTGRDQRDDQCVQ